MFGSRTARLAQLLALTLALLVLLPGLALADGIEADADALVAASPHANNFSATQAAGTTVAYDFSTQVKNTGNATNDVFPSGGGQIVAVTITRAGDWKNSSNAGSPASFTFSAYETPQAGTIRITVPAGTASGVSKTMTVTLQATASNGQTLSPNSVNLSYTITAAAGGDSTPPVVTVPAPITAEATGSSGAPVTYIGSANDNVDGALTPTCAPASGSTFALGTTTVNCSATDAAGNTGSNSFTVTVVDTTPPSVTAPANKTVEATGSSGAAVTYSGASATDLVGGSLTPVCTPTSGSTFALGTTTLNCSATDAAGNTGSASFTITVQDTTAPVVTAPADKTVEATSASGAAVTYANATASDLVDGSLAATCTPASGSTFPLGTTTVDCSATDAAGNTGHDYFDITVRDTTAPVVTAPDDIADVEAIGASGAAVTYSGATAVDAVDGALTPICTPASGSTFALGTTVVTCSAMDSAGNTGQDTFSITVVDTTAPDVTAPANITTEAASSAGAVVTYSGATASDIVDGAMTPVCTPASGGTFPLDSTTVTCTATDAAGNTGSATFTISVVDTTPPAVTAPANITAEATSSAGAVVGYSGATASDLVDGSLTPVCSPASGGTFPLDSTTVTCTATDAAGNTGSASFTITVVDTTPPAVTVPANMTVEATSAAGAVASFSPSASDLVSGVITPTCVPSSGNVFALGTTSVTCSATDAAGNTGSAQFEVSVVDTTPPAVTVPLDMTLEATGPSGAVATFTSSATDLVSGALSPSCVPPSGSTFPLETTTVNCSATDVAGNTGSDSFSVTVQDTTAPVVTVPTNMTALATSSAGAPVSYSASASDLVDGAMTPVCSNASGSSFAPGITTVTCTATDAAGNTGSASFTVTVGFNWSGFYAPVDKGIHNVVKAGATVPLKFSVLAAGGGYIRDLSIVAFKTVTIQCDSTLGTDEVEMTSTGGTVLRYDTAAEQFIQNWQTPKSPGKCARATITLTSGEKIWADFRLK